MTYIGNPFTPYPFWGANSPVHHFNLGGPSLPCQTSIIIVNFKYE